MTSTSSLRAFLSAWKCSTHLSAASFSSEIWAYLLKAAWSLPVSPAPDALPRLSVILSSCSCASAAWSSAAAIAWSTWRRILSSFRLRASVLGPCGLTMWLILFIYKIIFIDFVFNFGNTKLVSLDELFSEISLDGSLTGFLDGYCLSISSYKAITNLVKAS